MTVTLKNTKAEIYEAYKALQAQHQSDYITQAQLVNTAKLITRETALLARDCKVAGSVARQWVSGVVDTLKQPVLRYD